MNFPIGTLVTLPYRPAAETYRVASDPKPDNTTVEPDSYVELELVADPHLTRSARIRFLEAIVPTPAWDIRVDIRTQKHPVATDLTLDQALAYIQTRTPRGLAVVLPSGNLLPAGSSFTMFVSTVKGAQTRLKEKR